MLQGIYGGFALDSFIVDNNSEEYPSGTPQEVDQWVQPPCASVTPSGYVYHTLPECRVLADSPKGLEDSGVHVLLERMNESKATNEDIRAFYKERAAIEDEYARKLTKLSKMPLGTPEIGTLKASLIVLQAETASMAATHASTAASLHLDVEEPHSASSNTMREKRKMV